MEKKHFDQAKEHYGFTEESFKEFLETQVIVQKVKDDMY